MSRRTRLLLSSAFVVFFTLTTMYGAYASAKARQLNCQAGVTGCELRIKLNPSGVFSKGCYDYGCGCQDAQNCESDRLTDPLTGVVSFFCICVGEEGYIKHCCNATFFFDPNPDVETYVYCLEQACDDYCWPVDLNVIEPGSGWWPVCVCAP